MKLRTARVRMFRNILDSGEVSIDEKVTCVVGKNESGKSALLHAIWRFNPARTEPTFSIPDHYPAWLEKRHRIEGIDQSAVKPIEIDLELESTDIEAVEARFGAKVVKAGTKLRLSKLYNNTFRWNVPGDEKQAVKNFAEKHNLTDDESGSYKSVSDFSALTSMLAEDIAKHSEDTETKKAFEQVQSDLTKLLGKSASFSGAMWEIVESRLPKFFYFAEYSKLPYSVKIDRVLKENKLSDAEATARALLVLGGTEDEYILNPDYERRKRELENVANVLTDDVNEYWSQNPDLRVEPDISQRTEQKQDGKHAVLDELKLRIRDNRHSLSLPFTEHSTGFQWFFSFLAAFSEYEYQNPPVVILLDEPAVGLHARAQADFLRFIEERLTKRCQVIYTTHSPFMVQPGKLERVRLVEDQGKEIGAVVSSDVLTRDRDTLFPLQGALGYDLVQHLFVAEHNLVVEGTSDYAYLKLISDFLEANNRSHLDKRWSIVPVGGADLIPTFVALLGNHLKITVLVDSRKGGNQRLDRMAQDGYLDKQRIILVGQIVQRNAADIEDLFEEDEYLSLYNKAFKKTLKSKDLKGTDPIVARIARLEGVERFDHGRPADVLLRERDKILPTFSNETLNRFEALFARINNTLGT